MKKMMNENKIIETLKYISQFVENKHDEGLGDYLHIVIGRTDINVIDETIYLLERKQKEIERYKKEIKNQQKEIEEKTTILLAGAEKVKQLEKEIEKKNSLIDVLQHRIEELLDNKKEINYIKPIDIPVHNYISEDKIREVIKHYNNELEHIKNGEEFENERPMYYWGKVALEELLEEQY